MTLREAAERLRAAGIPEPLYEARRLFEAFAHIPLSEQIGRDPSSDDPALCEALKRRAAHEPLAYLLGEWGFYRETYLLSPDCLIPREDTELLVEVAIAELPEGAYFADLCTGSGCVGLSVLAHTAGTRALLLDISAGAVETAKKNAERLGLTSRADFLVADVTAGVADGRFDAILSNPPYIKNSVYPTLSEEVKKEPPRAFLGG
ncbi:MAG TPA: peptide chain release factor N(5)-glutamine methyltransferase, partial [Clostridiales bacterium]|nr:peptide chain release factor N(5)-glutamine methyltransferase [Clostridiales bacterium]